MTIRSGMTNKTKYDHFSLDKLPLKHSIHQRLSNTNRYKVQLQLFPTLLHAFRNPRKPLPSEEGRLLLGDSAEDGADDPRDLGNDGVALAAGGPVIVIALGWPVIVIIVLVVAPAVVAALWWLRLIWLTRATRSSI